MQFSVHCEAGRTGLDNGKGVPNEVDARTLTAAQRAEGKKRDEWFVANDEPSVLSRGDGDVGDILRSRIRNHRTVGERQDFVDVGAGRRNHVESARNDADSGSNANVFKGAAQNIAGRVHGAGDARVRLAGGDQSMREFEGGAILSLNGMEAGLPGSLGQLLADSDEERNGNSGLGDLARGGQDPAIANLGEDYAPLERRRALADAFSKTQRIGPFLNFLASALAMAG